MTPPDESLERRLLEEACRFEFFQAIRMLERIHPDRQPVGRHAHPDEEVVHLRTNPSLAFPASEIFDLERVTDHRDRTVDTLWVNFMGLAGLLGALPGPYRNLLADTSTKNQTAALREFLDLFGHRMISLFYRAWEKNHFAIAWERGDEDTFSQYLFSLIGLGTPGLQGRLHIDDQILLYYAGLLVQRPHSAVALEGILRDYFGVDIEVVQFQGQWFQMNADLLSSLGAHGQNNQLGVSAVLWERIWDPQARFRINVGPLGYTQFQQFLPGSDAYLHLVELTRFFVGEDTNFEVRPILRREEVPWCVLGGGNAVRLGWSMWLKERELEEDVSQPVFGARLATA
jgi:type VI secretion system protein ImpH